jgi:hypothetical protein
MNLEITDFGSCQYGSIVDYMKVFKNNMPIWTKTDLYSIQAVHKNESTIGEDGNITLAFSSTILNADVVSSILENIKNEFLKMFIEDGLEYVGDYGQDEYENGLNFIKNIKTIEECYNYCKNSSWDLWSANNFIMNFFYKPDTRGDFSENESIAISILWLVENGIIKDTTCFYGFGT